MSDTKSNPKAHANPAPAVPALSGSEVVAREKVMAAEAALMKAATEFAYQWGRDQTIHPKMYWLELHLDKWSDLARCALAYAECFDVPPNAVS